MARDNFLFGKPLRETHPYAGRTNCVGDAISKKVLWGNEVELVCSSSLSDEESQGHSNKFYEKMNDYAWLSELV